MSAVTQAFAAQSGHCTALGSPFMGRLMTLFAQRLQATDTPVSAAVLGWPGNPAVEADNVPLRLAGALHALVITDAAPELAAAYPPHDVPDDQLWQAVTQAMTDHAPHLLTWLANAPQTNEVRRACAVVPALHMIAARFGLPLHLKELGTSGGLNLRCDQFAVQAGAHAFGPDTARVRIAPDWTGPAPQPADLRIAARAGVDLNPLDPSDPLHALRLRAYLWPDQPDRRSRTDAAIALALTHPADIRSGDAIAWLSQRLSPVPGVTRVVFHTVAWQYFPAALQAQGLALLAQAGEAATEDTPLAHLGLEYDGGKGAALSLRCWPGGPTQALARVDFHGRWLDWTGPTAL